MRILSRHEMSNITGGSFWTAIGCGAGVVTLAAIALSPDPVSKFTLSGVLTGTIIACGATLSD